MTTSSPTLLYVPSENPEFFLQLPENKARIQAAMRNIETFPDMHEIVSGVWLGNQTAAGILMPFEEREEGAPLKKAACLAILHDRHISTIICCSHNGGTLEESSHNGGDPFKEDGLIYLSELLLDGGLLQCDPTEKAKAEAQFASFFQRAVKLMEAATAAGESVLVHCNSGANRSSSVVAGYLMLTQNKRFDEVMPIIFDKRPIVCPRYWSWLVEEVEPEALRMNLAESHDSAAASISSNFDQLHINTNDEQDQQDQEDQEEGETKQTQLQLPDFKRGLSGGFVHKCKLPGCHTMGPTVEYIQLHEKLCHNRVHEVARQKKEVEDKIGKKKQPFDIMAMCEGTNQRQKERNLLKKHEFELCASANVRIPECLYAGGTLHKECGERSLVDAENKARGPPMFQDMDPNEQELVLRFKPMISGEETVGRCWYSSSSNYLSGPIHYFLMLNIDDVGRSILFYNDIEVLSWIPPFNEYRHVPGVSGFGLALSMYSLHMHDDSQAEGRHGLI